MAIGLSGASSGQALLAMIKPISARSPSSRPACLMYSRSGVRTQMPALRNAGRLRKSSITPCRSTAAGQWL